MKSLLLFLFALPILLLSQGQAPVNFNLPSGTDTSQFNSQDAKGKYIVLHFLLKTECPYCLKHTTEYLQEAPLFPDVIHLFIKPDKEYLIKEWAQKIPQQTDVPIYRDINAALAKKLNIPFGYAFHGQTVHYPALIILNKEGVEVFRYIGEDNTDRYTFSRFAKKMRTLQKTN